LLTALVAFTALVVLATSSCSGVEGADDDEGVSDRAIPTIGPAASDTGSVTTPTGPEPAPRWTPLLEPGVGGRVTDVLIDPRNPQRLLAGGDLLGVAVSEDGGDTWRPGTGFASHEIGQITADPNRPDLYWAGTMSGPYRSDDGGVSWAPQRSGFPPVATGSYSAAVEIVLHDPATPDRLLAFGGSHREWESPDDPSFGAVWESTDAGESWARISTIASGRNIVDATYLADGSTLLVSVLDTGVFASTDGGATWERVDTGLPHQDTRGLAAHPSDPLVVWLALGNGTDPTSPRAGDVLRSDDGGRTWASGSGLNEQVGDDPNLTATYVTVAVAPSDPDVVYTADVSWGVNSLFRSRDGGRRWTQVLSEDNRPAMAYQSTATAEALAVNPTDPNDVMIGSAESVLRSHDGGSSWEDLTSSPVTDGGFVGRGWSGLVATDVLFNPHRTGEVMLLGFDGGNPIVSRDDLTRWTRPVAGHDPWGGAYAATVAGADGERLYVLLGQAGVFNGIVRSDDGGSTWSASYGAAAGLPDRYQWTGDDYAIHAFADQPDRVLAAIGGGLHLSTDGGARWSVLEPGLGLTDIGADPVDPSIVYIAGTAGVYQSTDRGKTLIALGGPSSASRVTYDAASATVYATAWRAPNGGLFRYRDGEWTQLTTDPFAYEVAVDPSDSDHLLLVGNDHPFHDEILSFGVLRSTDGGLTWNEANEGLTMRRVSAVAFDPHTPGRAIVGTFGQGFFVATRLANRGS